MYEFVNDALNAVLLDGRYEARPLYLVLDNAARRDVARELGCDEGQVEAICCAHVGRSLAPVGDPYRQHEKQMRLWRWRGSKTKPPMTALLYTLSHAAELMANSGTYTSGNYYNRLAEVTGLPASRLSQFGASTPRLWTAFSRWLSDNDYQYGQPTARPLNAFRYVSLAMSQAVIRAAERECFHHLFEKYRFSSTDELSEDEMAHYIGAWIHSAGANQKLRAAWQKTDLRPRICEVALAELEQWTGSTVGRDGNAVGGVVGLSLAAAVIPDFPSRKFALSIGRRGEVQDDIFLRAQDTDCEKNFVLANSAYGTFASIAPATALDMQDVLEAGACFDAADGNGSYAWRPRIVIPFTRSDSGPFWTEANRASIGAEHMILVRGGPTRVEQVNSLLAEAAVPGYTAATSAHLVGLPPGWTLYENVKFVRAPRDVPIQLVALSPVSDRASLQLLGGLPLSRGIWHRSKPPTLHLEARDGTARIEVTEASDDTEGAGDLLASANGTDTSVSLSITPELASGDGVLTAEAFIDEKRVSRSTILLRSADRPRPLDRQARGRLAYRQLTTATQFDAVADDGIRVEGMCIAGSERVLTAVPLPRGFDVLGATGEREQDAPLVGKAAQVRIPRVRSDDPSIIKALGCQKTAIHVWVYETMPPGYPASKPAAAECSSCGAAILTKNRGRIERHKPRARAPAPPPPAPVKPGSEEPGSRLNLDLVLDALCFLGSGSWGSFEALVAADLDQPWEALEVARNLVALGHLDIARKAGSGRISSWSVPPATVAFTGDNEAVLAGFRCDTLLAEVRGLAELADGRLEQEKLHGQPARLVLRGVAAHQATELFDRLVDPLGRPACIVDNAAKHIAAACALMGNVETLLRPITIGQPDYLQAFDLQSGRWRTCEDATAPGAYRFQHAGQTYALRRSDGSTLEGPHELVKLLAAREARVNLHAYSPEKATFTCMLGCEPPGILRRALVACTGKLPSRVAGVVTYESVPADVAATLLNLLYPGHKE